jgi:cold-inducible RNA-binding protein
VWLAEGGRLWTIKSNANTQKMEKKLYIGNLAWTTTTDSLKAAFSKAGEVVDAIVMTEKMSGRSRGFGFVTMATDEATDAAIAMWNEQDLEGRNLVVNRARPKTDTPMGAPRRDFGGRGNDRGGDRGGDRGFRRDY